MGFQDRRASCLVVWLLVVAALTVWGRAHAIDTSQCGFLKCETVRANYNASWHTTGCWREMRCVSATDGGANGQTRYLDPNNPGQCNVPANNPWVQSAHFAPCNCSAQPPQGPGTQFALNNNGEYCNAGCLYKPHAGDPIVCTPHDLSPGSPLVCTSESGWSAPGINCDPVTQPQPTPPPSNPHPLCDAEGHCIQPLVPPPPDIPKICGSGPEGSRGCAPLPGPGCGTGSGGYTCTGDPPKPPDPPPPPPPNPPPQYPPPDFHPPGVTYNGGPITVSSGGPPRTAPCPAGSHGSQPNCIPDANPCPDGSNPVNGTCPAPPGNCPDGTRPVGGQCNAPPGPGGGDPGPEGCPEGSTEYNGRCYQNCQGGTPPTNGMCPPSVAPCPSGATPVNGRCPVGEACDPATDPHQCNDGHIASGGETCGAAPACSGDMILCNSNYQIWKTRCGIEKLNPNERPTAEDFGPSFTQGQAWGADGEVDASTLDAGGWLGGSGQCPALPTLSLMGHSFAMADWVPCSTLSILSVLILLGGYVQAAYIIGGRK